MTEKNLFQVGPRPAKSPMKKTLFLGLILLLPFLSLPAVCVIREWPDGEAEPPANVDSLREYLSWRPDSTFFLEIRNDQGETLLVHGRISRFLSSGPAAYAFDEKGKLVDWTSDRGDDGAFTRGTFGRNYTTERLSKDEALSRFSE